MRSKSNTVEMSHVRVVFGGGSNGVEDVLALDDVSLHVAQQEIVSLVGPSGCGKTTILNLIAGFLRADEGSVLINGKPVVKTGSDRLLVFQTPALFPWLTVAENVTFGLRHRGMKRQEFEARGKAAIEACGLTGFDRHYPYQLSGGMRQRVQIARSLICEPQVMLLDEPFGALDAQTRLTMQRWLLDLHEKYKPSVLAITHDVEEALFLSDRVYVMSPRPGRIHEELVIDFPRPRDLSLLQHPRFVELKAHVLAILHAAPQQVAGKTLGERADD